MYSHLEKCAVCERDLSSADETCGLCNSPFIFAEYFLDVVGREQYKHRLENYRKRWKRLNNDLTIKLDLHKKDWSKNTHWADIWRQVSLDVVSLGLDEPAAVRLAHSLSVQMEDGEGTIFLGAPVNHTPEDSNKEIREKIAAWINNLNEAEYNVVDWVCFTDTLGGALGFDEFGAIRDEELRRQFFDTETVSVNAAGGLYNHRKFTVKRFVETLDRGIEIIMIKIPGGSFEMGNNDWDHTSPLHTVNIADFYIGTLHVTQLQWDAVAQTPRQKLELESNPSHFRGIDLPVDSVSWLEATEFCERLSERTGRKYRLPSEAEWEYAARAKSTAPFTFGEMLTPSLANYEEKFINGEVTGSSRNEVISAGRFPANTFGLHDVHGNIWEWCGDTWHRDYAGAPADGKAWTNQGELGRRVLRGGSWCHWAELCALYERIGENENREGKLNYVGFRLALDL